MAAEAIDVRPAARDGELRPFDPQAFSNTLAGSAWSRWMALQGCDGAEDLIDRDENTILRAHQTGAGIAEARLWIALSYHPEIYLGSEMGAELDAAARAADLAPFKRHFASLDWDVKFFVGAIDALRGETVHG